MFFQYNKINENNNNLIFSNLITNEQKNWLKMQKLLSKTLLNKKKYDYPENYLSKSVRILVFSKYFEFLSISFIIANIIEMCLFYDEMSVNYKKNLDTSNRIFTYFFLLECIMRILAKGFKNYILGSKWDLFDSIIVMISVLEDIILNYFLGFSNNVIKYVPKSFRIFKILRLGRILKLARKLTGLRNLMNTLFFSIPPLLNIASIALMNYFIFANLGCFLFNHIKKGNKIDNFFNFWNFKYSFITLFRISTGEDWHLFMFDLNKHNGIYYF